MSWNKINDDPMDLTNHSVTLENMEKLGKYAFVDYTKSQVRIPLCFTANEAGSTITLTNYSNAPWTNGKYSRDGETWVDYIPGTTGTLTLENAGDKLYFKGLYTDENTMNSSMKFAMTGSIAASGNIMSFACGDNFANVTAVPYDRMFVALFTKCTALTSAPILPATQLTRDCYGNLFFGCTNLKNAPALPALTVAPFAYAYMFYNCTSLTSMPVLPATVVGQQGYEYMFNGCTNLINIVSLPATSVGKQGYISMFSGCSKLEHIPNLPTTSGLDASYAGMFYNASKLKISDTQTEDCPYEIKIPSAGAYSGTVTMTNMFKNCDGTRASDTVELNNNQVSYWTQNQPV